MAVSEEAHYFFMQRALELGLLGRLQAPPNPWVGCLIVQQGTIVGQGYTQPFGGAHAETLALAEAGERAKGATAYISLEPCAHQGKTGPCTDALIRAGIKEVVIPILDPDPKVSGKGVRVLEEGGVRVIVGPGAEEALRLFAPYLHHRKTGKPYCILKVALSLDGKLAAADGSSRWITGATARKDVHRLRAESQAILIGSTTALKDHPQLTVRDLEEEYKQPLRIVLDRRGRLKEEGLLFDRALGETLHITETIDLEELLSMLGARGVMQLLIEGGSEIHSSFLKQKLCQRLVIYQGAVILGGEGQDCFCKLGIATMNDAMRCTLIGCKQFGDDVRVDYSLQ